MALLPAQWVSHRSLALETSLVNVHDKKEG